MNINQLLEKQICQEIDCLTIELLTTLEEKQSKLESYGDQRKRILRNTLFNLLVNMYMPPTNSPITRQNFERYAESIRSDFNSVLNKLEEFKPSKIYQ